MKSNDPSKKEAALSGRFLFYCLLLFVFQSLFQPFASQAAGCYRSDPGAFPQTAIPLFHILFSWLLFHPVLLSVQLLQLRPGFLGQRAATLGLLPSSS